MSKEMKQVPILNNDPYTANTPRVYDAKLFGVPDDVANQFVILLSDHKEVVHRLEIELTRAVDVKKDTLKCNKELNDLVDRQALAIEKLREQRDEALVRIANGVYCPSDDISEAEEEITAILQEAK